MIALPEQSCTLSVDRVEIAARIDPPVRKGSLDVWLSVTRGGKPAHPSLARTVLVVDGIVNPFTLFTRDLRRQWPKGGRVHVVVAYAGDVLASGVVKLAG